MNWFTTHNSIIVQNWEEMNYLLKLMDLNKKSKRVLMAQ